MSVWVYGDSVAKPPEGVRLQHCLFCGVVLRTLTSGADGKPVPGSIGWPDERRTPDAEWNVIPSRWVDYCQTCGWWAVSHHVKNDFGWYVQGTILRASAILRELEPSDLTTPLDELRRHLLARYSDRFQVHPKRYEDLVGQVFNDFGFQVRVTSYSGDEGVDLFVFDGPENQITGVQVKRYRGKIEAEQVRAFTGALFLRGLTAGIFVTTSGFRRGAQLESLNVKQRGIPIALWDADRFYSALRLTARDPYECPDDPGAPFATAWQSHDGLPLADILEVTRG